MIDGAEPGHANSVDALFATAYQELRKLARLRLRGGGRNTVLDTTSLVHESYLRLAKVGPACALRTALIFCVTPAARCDR